jgi:hypothetical protein
MKEQGKDVGTAMVHGEKTAITRDSTSTVSTAAPGTINAQHRLEFGQPAHFAPAPAQTLADINFRHRIAWGQA